MNLQHMMVTLLRNRGGDPFEALRRSLFSANEQGLWPRPDQFNAPLTQYKESTGQNIVTAVGDTVGLAIDWRCRLLEANVASPTSVNGVAIGGPATTIYNIGTVVSGRFYEVLVTVENYSGTSNVGFTGSGSDAFAGVVGNTISANGTIAFRVYASGTDLRLFTRSTNTCNFTNISVRELPGNHAYQATASKRPLLARVPARGRVNELIETENLAAVVWSKPNNTISSGVSSPIGGSNLVVPNGVSAIHLVTQVFSATSGVNYTISGYFRSSGYDYVHLRVQNTNGVFSANQNVRFNLSTGTAETLPSPFTAAGVVDEGGGWYRCWAIAPAIATAQGTVGFIVSETTAITFVGNGVSGISSVGLMVNSDTLTNYQRVGAGIYDVTEVGQPTLYGWLSDGVDDNFETNAFDPGTDKATVVAGVRKVSDAANYSIVEFSPSSSSNNGSLAIETISTGGYQFRSTGSVAARLATTSTGHAAPISRVLTGIGDISGDISRLRINGVQTAENLFDQGTINYGNYKTYALGRAGTLFFFPGYIFALCLRFAATDSVLLSRLENFTAVKTLGAKL